MSELPSTQTTTERPCCCLPRLALVGRCGRSAGEFLVGEAGATEVGSQRLLTRCVDYPFGTYPNIRRYLEPFAALGMELLLRNLSPKDQD